MKFIYLFFLSILSSFIYAQDTNQQKLFSKAEMVEDLNFLFENLEKIHPDLYHYTPKAKIDLMRENIRAELTKPMTKKEFALKVIPIVTSLKDGHTSLRLPPDIRSEYLNKGGTLFPFSVRILDNQVYIRENFSSDSSIFISSEILSINSIDIVDVLNNFRKLKSSELDHFRDIQIEKHFRRLLWYSYGFDSSYTLQLRHKKESYKKVVTGINLDAYKKITKTKNLEKTTNLYSYRHLENTSIGVLNFKKMYNKNLFRKFLDSTFTEIKNNNIKHLIIDIRQNGGGNSQLTEMLFDYITDKPYETVKQMDLKVSKQTKKNIKRRNIKWYLYPIAYPLALFVNQARPYFYGKNGNIKTIRQKKLTQPKDIKLKFEGDTYLLTSHYTFSSANMLAIAYKCYEMGTIVGEETGGIYTAFGELTDFQLPNTKLTAYCSSKRYIQPCDDGALHGVIPDIEIKSTIDNQLLGKDMAIEHIKESIK